MIGMDLHISMYIFMMYISKILDQNSLISIVFIYLCCCPISKKSLFHMDQQSKSAELEVKFRQTSNCCKRVFEAAKLAYINKKMILSLPRNLALMTFGNS